MWDRFTIATIAIANRSYNVKCSAVPSQVFRTAHFLDNLLRDSRDSGQGTLYIVRKRMQNCSKPVNSCRREAFVCI